MPKIGPWSRRKPLISWEQLGTEALNNYGNFTWSSGGGIFNDGGNVSISQSYLTFNTSTNGGRAVTNEGGTMVIDTTEIDDNSAGPWGGAIWNYWPQGNFTSCYLAVTNCTLRFNYGSSGGAIASGNIGGNAPILLVENCGFYNNNASFGAGIDNVDSGSMTVLSSTFGDNVAGLDGGAIYNNFFSTATVEFSRLTHNSAAHGGGIYNAGVLNLGSSVLLWNIPDNLDNRGMYHNLGANIFK
jgi:hypothetical protein